jgi:S1-C subfamily serine protease
MSLGLDVQFDRYRTAMARIRVEPAPLETKIGYGAAFHIGDGWLVTADHCLPPGRKFSVEPEVCSTHLEIRHVERAGMPSDLALIQTDLTERDDVYAEPAVVEIGTGATLDDSAPRWVMSAYLVMGYPDTKDQERVLVADGGFVNAFIEHRTFGSPLVLLSGLPRQGFSGGPVISEFGMLLGVVSQGDPSEEDEGVYHASAVSVEPLWHLLAERRIFPDNENGKFARFVREQSERPPRPERFSRSGAAERA